jgi:hypothetical protein
MDCRRHRPGALLDAPKPKEEGSLNRPKNALLRRRYDNKG